MNPRILIVDDEEPICTAIQKFLSTEGWIIDISHGFDSAVTLLQSTRYDIILIDKNMPGTDGLNQGGMELLRVIRARSVASDVIMMTGYATLDTAIEAMRLGAFDYLLKPFSMFDLKVKLDRLLGYRSFLDPAKTKALHKTINEKILNLIENKGNLSDSEVDQALKALNETIDEVFKFVKECEQFMLSHRESLAHIAGYAERLKTKNVNEADSQNLVEEIYRHSINRL